MNPSVCFIIAGQVGITICWHIPPPLGSHIAAPGWKTPGTARVNSSSQLLSSSGSAGRGIVLGKGHHCGEGGG